MKRVNHRDFVQTPHLSHREVRRRWQPRVDLTEITRVPIPNFLMRG